ncbi:MAG: sodium:solute symporter [Candidatus Pedobacter colombiensis]|uniref:Sodium:solute symporter n=1 Tax=Candidatus Pedobacter colombiensis TaxID=3121371 RepID=A0AAJ6B5F1_9SPHI|nr:sodium:solute symporter [Pedobacter sp.]WEK17719.1 MAG: sodium:solute symporter [Pedobacter sp.]
MKGLPIFDLVIIVIYLIGMILVGIYFSRNNKNSEQFTKASGLIPGWAIGLSIYATFLSSNTFLGVPGKAFGGNWNAFVFSLSMPLAAWVASKYFVPYYRGTGEISAYTHLENRFGAWARTYAVVCFLLTQLARMGSIFFGIALSLQALTGYSMQMIMVVMGVCIIIYTVLGGIEAVIWTEVVQAVVKTFGALLILYLIITNMPGGIPKVIEIGKASDKFSLGSFSPDFVSSSFWVVLLYGFFINLNNFGMDQNYVQRYHTASSSKSASKSIWLCVWLYVPASLMFFVIGSCLYAYYDVHPELIENIKHQVALERLPLSASAAEIMTIEKSLQPADYGDKIMPHFMVTKIPVGLVGLIVSAILSAAMSTISSGMNSSATVFTVDIYKRYFKPGITEKQNLSLLHIATVVFGLLGMGAGIAMIGVKSILDVWWELSGIFAAGMLGLFLLGIASRQTKNHEALIATMIGIVVIIWMTFSAHLPEQYEFLRNPLNKNMIIVIGTLSIFLAGIFLTRLKNKNLKPAD